VLQIVPFIALLLSPVFTLFGHYYFKGGLVVPSNYQVCAEMLYTFITSLVREQLGQANGAKYISIVFTVFLYILTANLLGLIPFSFATGSTCCCFWSALVYLLV
jgi:F0F1-type ATP synthase membrane subunit a